MSTADALEAEAGRNLAQAARDLDAIREQIAARADAWHCLYASLRALDCRVPAEHSEWVRDGDEMRDIRAALIAGGVAHFSSDDGTDRWTITILSSPVTFTYAHYRSLDQGGTP
jgi:hypothetical protein